MLFRQRNPSGGRSASISAKKPKTSRWFGIKTGDPDLEAEEPVKRWKRRRKGTVPADVKLPYAQFRQLRGGVLLEHVLDYYSEHEADQAQAERWRVHLGQDSDRRSKALRAQIERKVREG